MPIPCKICGRKSLNKRGGFLNIAVYSCKCGAETFQIETDVKELLRNSEQRGHPLCGNWTVDDILDMLKKQNLIAVGEKSARERSYKSIRNKREKPTIYIECNKCKQTEKANPNESPEATAKRLGWTETTTGEETSYTCNKCTKN